MADQDPRIEPFARFMQQRDARIFEVQGTDGNFQSWDEIGEMGQEEYVKDAEAYIKALDVIEAQLPPQHPEFYCGKLISHSPHVWTSAASKITFECSGHRTAGN